MPTKRRSRRTAATPAEQAPAKQSRTVQGIGSAGPGQVQEGRQPVVVCSRMPGVQPLRASPAGKRPKGSPSHAFGPAVELPLKGLIGPLSTSRTHGAKHLGQHPRSLVPARTQGSTRATGKVEKWASLKGLLATVQTERRLRPAG